MTRRVRTAHHNTASSIGQLQLMKLICVAFTSISLEPIHVFGQGDPCTEDEDSCLGHYECIEGFQVCKEPYMGPNCTIYDYLREKNYDILGPQQCPDNNLCLNNGTCWSDKCCCTEDFYGKHCQYPVTPESEVWRSALDRTYKIFQNANVTCTEANKVCLEEDSILASIGSKNESEGVRKIFNKYYPGDDTTYVIGLQKYLNESEFRWLDETPFEYSQWKISVDAAVDDDVCVCAEMVANTGEWTTISCDVPISQFICERVGWKKRFFSNVEYSYYVPPYKAEPLTAESVCEMGYGHLAFIFSTDENTFVTEEVARPYISQLDTVQEYYIGLHHPVYQSPTATFSWIHAKVRSNYRYWGNRYSDQRLLTEDHIHNKETCAFAVVEMYNENRWFYQFCNQSRHFVCKRPTDPCVDGSCENGGICLDDTVIHTFVCNCSIEFCGPFCEFNNPCHPNPCLSKAECVVESNCDDFSCVCPPARGGKLCDEFINYCDSEPCYYDSTCITSDLGFTCECGVGLQGTLCEDDIDECGQYLNFCGQHGRCINTIGNFVCECISGFTGIFCDNNIDECSSLPCVFGICVDGINNYTCDCTPGYSGPNCTDASGFGENQADSTTKAIFIAAVVCSAVGIIIAIVCGIVWVKVISKNLAIPEEDLINYPLYDTGEAVDSYNSVDVMESENVVNVNQYGDSVVSAATEGGSSMFSVEADDESEMAEESAYSIASGESGDSEEGASRMTVAKQTAGPGQKTVSKMLKGEAKYHKSVKQNAVARALAIEQQIKELRSSRLKVTRISSSGDMMYTAAALPPQKTKEDEPILPTAGKIKEFPPRKLTLFTIRKTLVLYRNIWYSLANGSEKEKKELDKLTLSVADAIVNNDYFEEHGSPL